MFALALKVEPTVLNTDSGYICLEVHLHPWVMDVSVARFMRYVGGGHFFTNTNLHSAKGRVHATLLKIVN